MSARSYFGKDDITPDFLKNQKSTHSQNSSDTSSSLTAQNSVTSDRSTAASRTLKQYEDQSTGFTTNITASSAEKKFYTGSGKPNKSKKENQKKHHGLKKTAPAMIVLGIVFGFIFFMFGSASFLGSQIEHLVTRATDTMFGSYSENTIRITKEVLDGKRGSFPTYLEDRFKERNITVEPNPPGYALIYEGNTITSANFDVYYDTDIGFREAFIKTKRGRTSNFFDIGAGLVYGRLMLSRNLFNKYRATDDSKTNTENYRATESSVFEGGTDTALNTVTEIEVEDENGNTHVEKVASGPDIESSNISGDSPLVKAKGYLMNLAGRITDAGGIACAALKVGNIISTAVAVNEIYRAINYFMSNQENVSKTLAGHGEYAAMNPYLTRINDPVTTTYIDAESGEEKTITGAAINAEGFANALAGEKVDLNKTKNYSIESAFITTGLAIGLTAANNKLCGGIRVAGAAISILSFALSGGLFSSVIALAKTIIVNSAIQGTVTAMLSALIPRIARTMFTNPTESITGIPEGELLVEGADLINKKNAREGDGQLLADRKTATVYNKYTVAAASKEAELDRATRSPFDATNSNTFLGSFVGKFAFITGSNSILGALSSTASLIGSSLGSLSKNLIGSASAADLSGTKTTPDHDLTGVDFQTIYSDEETCKNLTSIGAACDMYGAEITAVHPDVINIASDDPTYLKVLKRNVRKTEDGHYKVIEGSLLSKKVKYCDGRDSPFGVIDANIINDFEVSLGALDAVPVLGDVVDMVSAVESSSDEALGWGTGAYCVMSEENNPYYEDLLYLQHFEEDQRIASQMKLDEVTDENGNDVNAITAYMTDYYSNHPLDTSEAGILAHYTGSTKEDAELALALIDYVAYLSDYIPPSELPSEISSIHNLKTTPEPLTDVQFFQAFFGKLTATNRLDLTTKNTSTLATQNHSETSPFYRKISFAPLRNKSYAA